MRVYAPCDSKSVFLHFYFSIGCREIPKGFLCRSQDHIFCFRLCILIRRAPFHYLDIDTSEAFLLIVSPLTFSFCFIIFRLGRRGISQSVFLYFYISIGRREIPKALLCRCPVLVEWIIQKEGLRHGCVSAVIFLSHMLCIFLTFVSHLQWFSQSFRR